jgi:hypothetical protein
MAHNSSPGPVRPDRRLPIRGRGGTVTTLWVGALTYSGGRIDKLVGFPARPSAPLVTVLRGESLVWASSPLRSHSLPS